MTLLGVTGLSKRFGGLQAVGGLDLSVSTLASQVRASALVTNVDGAATSRPRCQYRAR